MNTIVWFRISKILGLTIGFMILCDSAYTIIQGTDKFNRIINVMYLLTGTILIISNIIDWTLNGSDNEK
ncbi:hypothetical protein [Lentilactobacillus otakiensis]|uniref:hypothetical protein n=1 Tax=Lentilactobacillus otakiensis TaxID=481720 RepID=UPI003D16C467